MKMDIAEAPMRLGSIYDKNGCIKETIVCDNPLTGRWVLQRNAHGKPTGYAFVIYPAAYERMLVNHATVMLGLPNA